MRGRLHGSLKPVVQRQLGQLLIRSAARGLLVGSAGAVAVGVFRLFGFPVPPGLAAALLLGVPLFAVVLGAIVSRGYKAAASAVDAHYHLKDRARTALEFSAKAEPSVLQSIQVEDAEEHLAGIEAHEVVPFRAPKALAYAASLTILALGLLAWPVASSQSAKAGPTAPRPEIVAEAEKAIERLKELDELARSERDPELEKLVKELVQKAEEMKQPGVDLKEALAKLSEMQAAIAMQQAKYNVGLVDAQLQSLGAAMQAAEATDAAGQALQEGKFEQATKELEKLETPPLDKKEARTLEEKLRQVAKQMGDVGLVQMSGAATEMAEGIAGGNKAKFQKATRTLAGLTKGHNGRRRIKQILDAELDALDESKAGESNGQFAIRGKKPEKTNSPSNDWGLTTSGNVLGDKTKLQATRKVEEITGNPGEGPSEMETTHSPEGKQKAARAYKDSYQKYKKMSEDVLDSEPIPLGHRQTIRKYFELIRPQNGASSTTKDAPASTTEK